jgi:hypothetical protein
MIIILEQIKKLNPCESSLEWGKKTFPNGEAELLEVLLKLNEINPANARWLFTKLMTKEQNFQIAIFAAELVIDIFEKKYPNDPRPREAIEAAKRYLENNTEENKNAAAKAANAAAYAATAANAAANAAAYAATAAANAAAYDATAAANAAANAAAYATTYATYAVNAVARKEVQEEIIREAVRILEEKCLQ